MDQFLNTLWLDHELELKFKKARVRSVELMVLALDLLSRLASCYGRCQGFAMSDNVGQAWLDAHLHRAEKLIYTSTTSRRPLASSRSLHRSDGPESLRRWQLLHSYFRLALLCIGGYIAYAGGKIRHREFRSESPPQDGMASITRIKRSRETR